MIKIDRSRVAAPKNFVKRARIARQELAAFVKGPAKSIAQRTLPFNDKLLAADDLQEALVAVFRGKCAICESPLVPIQRLSPEPFRPRHRAAQLDGKVDRLHYWWLAYDWNNLYAICGDCISAKGSRF